MHFIGVLPIKFKKGGEKKKYNLHQSIVYDIFFYIVYDGLIDFERNEKYHLRDLRFFGGLVFSKNDHKNPSKIHHSIVYDILKYVTYDGIIEFLGTRNQLWVARRR